MRRRIEEALYTYHIPIEYKPDPDKCVLIDPMKSAIALEELLTEARSKLIARIKIQEEEIAQLKADKLHILEQAANNLAQVLKKE